MDTNITYKPNLEDYDFSKLPEIETIPVIFKPAGKWWNNEIYKQAKNNIMESIIEEFV